MTKHHKLFPAAQAAFTAGHAAKVLCLELPAEFVDLCKADGTDPKTVLSGFIADLCDLDGNSGSDERTMAQDYYDRCGYRMKEELRRENPR